MGYGQHQSFYLRVNWLRKAIKQVKLDNRFLYKEQAAEEIGLGKNMVQSLRHWVVATGIVDEVPFQGRVCHEISQFGKLVDEFDPFIEHLDTASILHYHLVDNREPSTAWYWFFNCFNKRTEHKSEIMNELLTWIKQHDSKQPAVNSVKRDIDCMVRLYFDNDYSEDPEEVIQSPLSVIGLLHEEKGIVSKLAPNYTDIGLGALMYCLLAYSTSNEQPIVSVEEIEVKELLWGRVFNLRRNEIIRALEELTLHPYFPLAFDRTNRLNNVRVPSVSPVEFLRMEYARSERNIQ